MKLYVYLCVVSGQMRLLVCLCEVSCRMRCYMWLWLMVGCNRLPGI